MTVGVRAAANPSRDTGWLIGIPIVDYNNPYYCSTGFQCSNGFGMKST